MVTEEIRQTAAEYLPKLARGLTAIAELIRNGNEAEGAHFFVQATQGLRWLVGLLANIHLVSALEIEKFKENLNTLLTAWENKDYVLISDLLEYELAPFVEQVNSVLLSLKERKGHVF